MSSYCKHGAINAAICFFCIEGSKKETRDKLPETVQVLRQEVAELRKRVDDQKGVQQEIAELRKRFDELERKLFGPKEMGGVPVREDLLNVVEPRTVDTSV